MDEVQTGLGLTGTMWAYEQMGIVPDAVAMGKKIQTGGIMVGTRVDDNPRNIFTVAGRVASTWGGTLIDMVRVQRMLEAIEEDDLVANAASTGAYLLEGLRDVQEGGAISNARGRGLMIAFDLADPKARDETYARLLENGLFALKCGDKSVRFRPPLNLSRAEADEGLAILKNSL